MSTLLSRVGTLSLVLVAIATLGLSGCLSSISNGENTTATPVQGMDWINPLSAEKAVELMPFLATQPLVLKVHSDLCSDCQKLAPVLKKVDMAHPNVPVLTLNLTTPPECEDGKRNYDAIKNALKPVVTPTLVFFEQGGKNKAVLTGYQDEDTLEAEFALLETQDSVQVSDGMSLPEPGTPDDLFSCDA